MKKTFLLGVSLALLLTSYAEAATISITNVTVSTAGSTGNDLTGSRTRRISNAAIIDAGESVAATIGASVDGQARFTMAAETRHSSGPLGTQVNDFNANFTVTFDVVADAGVDWSLEISNTRLGVMLTGSGGGTAKADITGSTTLLNAAAAPGLNLADQGSLTAEDGSANISDSKSITLSGTGSQSYTFNSTWNAEADSTQGFFAKGDKVGVLMGEDFNFGETNSQVNYGQAAPNALGRTLAGDGHYVYFKATVVNVIPEPTSAAFLACCAAGAGVIRRRRR
jgi:hypothetical protein